MQETEFDVIVNGLRKAYEGVVVVRDVSFRVKAGEIFGIVGPNGAGKTTTLECVEGQRRRDGGSVRVLGVDPEQSWSKIRARVGVQLQEAGLPSRIRVNEALALFASFFDSTFDLEWLRSELDLPGRTFFRNLSGGEKQRLFVALAILHRPSLVFLDELTTGLDPHGRRRVWRFLEERRSGGCTVCLTTHFMEEAERLCDRVAVFLDGRILAVDRPAGLIESAGVDERVTFSVAGRLEVAPVEAIDGVETVQQNGDQVVVRGKSGILPRLVTFLEARREAYGELRQERATLEDAFLHLTGRSGGDRAERR